ncbi:MAG: iron-only hydrogenase system regulator [Clostridia bacterium]|jgi:putative iron-only hydrogenase system regulator|nr:iron-only hydrogenase system regulator [Clostridia bacterium]
MGKRIGIVAIIIEDKESVPEANSILSEYASIIIGRMGIPYKEKHVNVISIIVDGTTDEIGALSGKLGNLTGVTAKTVLAKENQGR